MQCDELEEDEARSVMPRLEAERCAEMAWRREAWSAELKGKEIRDALDRDEEEGRSAVCGREKRNALVCRERKRREQSYEVR